MTPNPFHRLPATIELALQRLKLTVRKAVERTVESLGLAAMTATGPGSRDVLMTSQLELSRKSPQLILSFQESFDRLVLRELAPRGDSGVSQHSAFSGLETPRATSWDALSLVGDDEVENQISAQRFGMDIAQACEWELRELDAYVGTVLQDAGSDPDRNPLRPEILGQAIIQAVQVVSPTAEVRKAVTGELRRSLEVLLRSSYSDIVADFRNAGVQPKGLSVRRGESREGARDTTGFGAMDEPPSSGSGPGTGFGADSRHGSSSSAVSGSGQLRGTPLGQVDPGLMSLIRRLAYTDGPAVVGSGGPNSSRTGFGEPGTQGNGPLPNLILTHREELRQAASGQLDHMVIDVIGFMFDQILADPKVSPQMARQIARLQLPVLRAALGDPAFFSSRKHPVRRFVNRVASLGAAFEDFSDSGAREFLAKVAALIQEVVEGEFDRVEVYDEKLRALEAFVAQQATAEAQSQGNAATLLQEKEDELRLRQLYAQRLATDLKDVAVPAFVRDFISRVWSQVLLRADAQGGSDGAAAQRLRRAGRELMLSVQPKPTPAHRKVFLAELPKLMQDLTQGMNLIGWPEAQRRAFFGQLMPAHAESLKSAAGRLLDLNLLARQVEGALERPVPSHEEMRSMSALPVLNDEVALPTISQEEAQRVGLVDESAVNWNGVIDIDLSAEADLGFAASQPVAPGLPAITEAPEPTRGRDLAQNIQIGFAYQMHLQDKWQRVRLTHVSEGRNFFIFTQGARHKTAVSLTQRMLLRLCETGRLRTYENATLIERATERARRQLAAMRTPKAATVRH